MKKLILTLMAAATLSGGFAQEATKITAGKHNDYGLAYSLPTTMVDVEINVTKIAAKRGPYYRYAEKYLGVQELITEDMTYWELNGITLRPVGVANPDESYVVKFKSGNPPSMYLSESGALLSINMKPEAAADASPAAAKKSADAAQTPSYAVLTEEQLAAGSTAKQAEMAAKQIYRLRESRTNLITGDVDQLPADGESFKLIMKQLDEQEAALTAMFLGTTVKETMTEVIRINPASKTGKEMLCRFSKYMGVVDNDNLSGSPVYIAGKIIDDFRLSEEEAKKKSKQKGVAYMRPGKMQLTVTSESKQLATLEFQVAQLGEVMQFPSDMFDDKKAPAKAVFSPETGAVLEIIN
jgi:hypothetical protein